VFTAAMSRNLAVSMASLKDVSAGFLAARERLFAYVFAVVRDRQTAEDLFQELYIALANAVEQGTVIGDLVGWCRGTARNLALKHWRSQRARAAPLDGRLLDRIDRAFEEGGAQADRLESLKQALARCCEGLGSTARALIDQRYRQGLAPADIASASGRTPRGVITTLARIRAQLMSCVQQRAPEGSA
jgi:RNA polymerase sigma-70 factor, ECF subfamily